MGSEQIIISNPKGNNRHLRITAVSKKDGRILQLATLKPGKSYRADKDSFTVTEFKPPVLLEATLNDQGVYVVLPPMG